MNAPVKNPLIIAHRGSSRYAPENTLAAFCLAYEQGADGIELDAKLTIDGEVIVIHDQTLDRTTGSSGRVIDQTLAKLKTLDAGSFFSHAFQGERIPTLDEVFRELGKKLLINVELTSYLSPGDMLPEKVADLVKKHGVAQNILFSSFHPIILHRIRKLLPDIPAALLTADGILSMVGNSFIGRMISPDWIHPHISKATNNFIKNQHDTGRKVNAWTVNDPDEIQRLIFAGVDGIITDDPIIAIKLREEYHQGMPQEKE